MSPEDRFWDKVDKRSKDECWNWIGGINDGNYGIFVIEHKYCRAHRVSWEIANGPIPENKLILHRCDNRKCVNPNHLYCGTHSDNMYDREKRNPVPPEITTFGKTKLYEGEIWLIKKLKIPYSGHDTRRRYKFSTAFVAKIFKVSQATISRIWNSNKSLCKEGYYV